MILFAVFVVSIVYGKICEYSNGIKSCDKALANDVNIQYRSNKDLTCIVSILILIYVFEYKIYMIYFLMM